MLKKFIPDYCFKSIYEIPLSKLYADGIRLILTDLDNTLISYLDAMPNDNLIKWRDEVIKTGFELIIVSNSKKDRVERFSKAFKVDCVKFSTKPLKRGIKKAINKISKNNYDNNQIIILGDQLMTDILGGNRCKIKTALIEAIDKSSDSFPTRCNRRLENFVKNRIKKKYPDEYLKLKELD